MSELKNEIVHAEEPKTGFVCENDQEAEWCILQIRRANEEKARWKEHYKEALASVTASCDETIGRMEMFLYQYFMTVPHKKTKTEENYALPSGKIMLKAQETDFEYDEAELLEWLKSNGKGFIRVKEVVDWDALKSTLTVLGDTVADEDAEVIPCIRAVEREPVFKVQIKKGGLKNGNNEG